MSAPNDSEDLIQCVEVVKSHLVQINEHLRSTSKLIQEFFFAYYALNGAIAVWAVNQAATDGPPHRVLSGFFILINALMAWLAPEQVYKMLTHYQGRTADLQAYVEGLGLPSNLVRALKYSEALYPYHQAKQNIAAARWVCIGLAIVWFVSFWILLPYFKQAPAKQAALGRIHCDRA